MVGSTTMYFISYYHGCFKWTKLRKSFRVLTLWGHFCFSICSVIYVRKWVQPAVQQMAVEVWCFRASDHRGTDSDLLIDMNMTCLQPPSRPLSGRKKPRLPLKFSEGVLAPLLLLDGLSFSSLWVGGCRLRFVTQWTWTETFKSVMVRVFGPRRGRKTCSRGAKGPCGHTFLNSSSAAYCHDQNIRSSHANTAVTTSHFHSHIWCLCCAPRNTVANWSLVYHLYELHEHDLIYLTDSMYTSLLNLAQEII